MNYTIPSKCFRVDGGTLRHGDLYFEDGDGCWASIPDHWVGDKYDSFYGDLIIVRPMVKPTPARAVPARAVPERKTQPVASGFLDYFPEAIRAIAKCSWQGNEQHNPGSELHWDRSKSGDESDALMRHFMERGTMDDDGVLHSTKVAWRALAMLQKELEEQQ